MQCEEGAKRTNKPNHTIRIKIKLSDHKLFWAVVMLLWLLPTIIKRIGKSVKKLPWICRPQCNNNEIRLKCGYDCSETQTISQKKQYPSVSRGRKNVKWERKPSLTQIFINRGKKISGNVLASGNWVISGIVKIQPDVIGGPQ